MLKTFNILASAPLLIGVALATGGPAKAETFGAHGAGPMAVTVRYADLDISQAPGARVLLKRITRAASLVCGNEPDRWGAFENVMFRTCRKGAIERAVARVDAPVLAAQLNPRKVVLAAH